MRRTADPETALAAARERVALVDRSDLARLHGDGPDLLPLLNRLSTAAVDALAVGAGRQTVLTSNKGRIVARLFVYRRAADVLLLGGPGGHDAASAIRAHVDRFTIAERTGLREAGDDERLWALVGPRADDALDALGLQRPPAKGALEATLDDHPLTVLDGDGDAHGPGRRALLVPAAAAEACHARVSAVVARLGGADGDAAALDALRVLDGLPRAGHELTEAYNPLEAGLWDAVDFDKGCYVGQEVVARLRTYDKVSRVLMRFELDSVPASVPAPLTLDGRAVGMLTSAVPVAGRDRVAGLGYVKRKALAEPLVLELADGTRVDAIAAATAGGPAS